MNTINKPISWNTQDFEQGKVKITPLVQNAFAKEIQILMAKDSVMKEHKAPFPISVQVLKGKIWFEVEGECFVLEALDMIALQANVPHSLGGLEDSIVRLSLAQSDSVVRVKTLLT